MAFRPITEVEAMALTRHQLLQRIEETQQWLHRAPNTPAKRAAYPEYTRLMYQHLNVRKMLDDTLAVARGHGPGAGRGYMDERLDGSPPRPPTRRQLSRRHAMPYGCKNAARPGRYGNPFLVAEHGDEAVPMFAHLLAHPDRYPEITYPTVEEIRADLGGWDLACWCVVPAGYISTAAQIRRLHLALAAAMLDQEDRCHVDVLLRVANGGKP